MDSVCRKASRCLLGVRVPLLMSLTLSLLQSRLPITIRGHGKTHGLSTQSFPERGEINGEAHGSPPSMTRAPDGRTTPDPTTQGITLPQEPRGYQGLPSFSHPLCTSFFSMHGKEHQLIPLDRGTRPRLGLGLGTRAVLQNAAPASGSWASPSTGTLLHPAPLSPFVFKTCTYYTSEKQKAAKGAEPCFSNLYAEQELRFWASR